MEIKKDREGHTITLDGDELAAAIDLYLYSKQVIILGPRTTMIDIGKAEGCEVFADPSACVMYQGTRHPGDDWAPVKIKS